MSRPTRRTRSPCCARAASDHDAAAPPSSVTNSRRFMPNMGSSSPAIWRRQRAQIDRRRRSVYRTLNLPQNGRQVLGPDLNRSGSRRGALPVPSCTATRTIAHGGGSPLHCGISGPSTSVCGRRRLGKNFLSCCSIGRVRSCGRPVLCGGEAAGHNALRGSGPNQKHAFKDALTQTGFPDPRIDLVCITSSCPRQFLQTSNAVVVSWPHLLESLWL